MKFSIRDLLWLTLLVAFAVAWWIDRGRLAAEVERLRPKAIDIAWPVSVIRPVVKPQVVQPRQPQLEPSVIGEPADDEK
jgi:hypothetical protein